jgi:hypothetical protein
MTEAFRESLLYQASPHTLIVVMRGVGPAETALHKEICAMMADVRAREAAAAGLPKAA